DARCAVDLDNAAFRGEGSVLAVEGASLARVAGLDGFAGGWFTRGKLTFSAGPNAGLAVEVKGHRIDAGEVRLSLWQQRPMPLADGYLLTRTAGCDKGFETSCMRFATAINYRRFPHLPGNDFVASYAVPGEPGHDGGTAR